MNAPRQIWILLGSFFILAAAAMFLIPYGPLGKDTKGHRAVEERKLPTSSRWHAAHATGHLPAAVTTMEEVVKMSPSRWESRLALRQPRLDPDLEKEVILLAAELEESIAGGLDPNGVEAQAFSEAILTLISMDSTGN